MGDAIVFVSVITVGLLLRFALERKAPVRFRRKPLMTGVQADFFRILQEALPECHICPQMAVSALIEPAGSSVARRAAMNEIETCRVGYAVFDADMQLLAVIELVHRAKPSRKDMRRETCLASAGIHTLRYNAQRMPSIARIHNEVYRRNRDALPARRRQFVSGPDSLDFKSPGPAWPTNTDLLRT